VAEWFPRKERALATGIFSAGSNVGAVITPLTVPWITIRYGWRWAFILTGALGLGWLVLWVALYPPQSVSPSLRISWTFFLKHRQAWAIAIGKFLTDPFWWLYLFWVPDFLHKAHGVTLVSVRLPLVAIYLAADIGSLGGGWLSSALLKKGWSVNAARKTALLVCAIGVVPIVFAAKASSLWPAVGLIGLAAASHQGWSANMYTLVTDMFPQSIVGSMAGFVGMVGAVGGMLIAKVVGYILQWTGSYFSIFVMAGCAYLTALLIVHMLVPRLEPVPVER
jgi:MFS transporter, ACS family, hexuronate transporter